MTKRAEPAKRYALNVVLQSTWSGQFYFCPKVEVLRGGLRRVVGKKVDVTASMRELFGPMLDRENKLIERKRRKGAK